MVSDLVSRISDAVSEQSWFQELRAKWDELDPQSRFYLKILFAALVIGGIVVFFFASAWSGYRAKAEFEEKTALVSSIQKAADELRDLKAGGLAPVSEGGESTPTDWGQTLRNIATQAGIDASGMEISAEKPGKKNPGLKETLLDVSLKKTNVRQVVKFAFFLENGGSPIKIRNMSVDALDAEGFLEAKLSVSAYSAAQEVK